MPIEPISASSNHRFLTIAGGQPFFWLADTAWELFHRLNRAEAEYYFETRRQQGCNVIRATILGELNGLHIPNANGHVPLLGDDPTRPNEFYFRFVDEVIRLAASKGLYIALLPTWGDKVHRELWGSGPVIFNIENARVYGRRVTSCWFDPRSGKAHAAGEYGNEVATFTSPIAGPDWVLVLDDQLRNFSKPGDLV